MGKNTAAVRAALRANRRWFRESGIMNPPDGGWGVGERILLTGDNPAAQKAIDSFPGWSFFDGGCVLEQRRADCCFQSAWYFLLLSDAFHSRRDLATAEKLTEFLYCKSGLLSRSTTYTRFPVGVWNWSHLRWHPAVWFDDNAWCVIIALKIASRRPDWEARFDMIRFAAAGAEALGEAFAARFDQSADAVNTTGWSGTLRLPHWGAPAIGALAAASPFVSPERREQWLALAKRYYEFVDAGLATWNTSELSYALFGSALSAAGFGDPFFSAVGRRLAERLTGLIDPVSGCLPSGHYEAPAGEALADLIYTMNWAALALQEFSGVDPDRRWRAGTERLIELFLKIQDRSESPRLGGCWRGMYDVEHGRWGGGDCYEGGAGSIYSGWTNAPIGIVLANSLVR